MQRAPQRQCWPLSACSGDAGRDRRRAAIGRAAVAHACAAGPCPCSSSSCAGGGCSTAPSRPAEVQLKPKHQPYKLGRQWPELLLRFTDAPDDDVATGQCAPAAPVRAHLGLERQLPAQPGLWWQRGPPWPRGRASVLPRPRQPLPAGEPGVPRSPAEGGPGGQ